ncbi:sialidase family protein [Ruania zhangjianzhongii]|nr:sialidase family protein [Ruania zhangjianzhongii]
MAVTPATGAPVEPTDPGDAAEEVEFAEDVIFERGEDGYFCFRIPAVVETNDGTLLAFAEGRRSSGCDDSGDIDTVLRRSQDGGDTWGPIEVVFDAGVDTAGNPTPVVDSDSGRIALITTHNPALNHNLRTPYLQYSEDDGATWSEPEDIGDDITDPDWEKWLATGPGAGIQLDHGPHAGRMVIGMNHEGYIFGSESHQTGASLAYSDDGGLTWQHGAEADLDPAELKPQELTLAELPDGQILVSGRDQHGAAEGTRAFTTSSDGGESFDGAFENDPDLQTPVSQGSMTSFVDADGTERVLFSGGSHPRSRVVLSVRSSFDGGATWQTWDEGRVVNWGNAGYSDLLAVSDGTLALAYETGEEDAYREIRVARFNSAYLDSANEEAPGVIEHPPGPTTPDVSPRENTAYVRGEPHIVDGVHESAFEFDLAAGDGDFDDRVDVPYGPDVDLDDSDFTISTWFRYGEESHDQTLVWAYHMGSGLPGLWIRAEPGSDRVRAMLGTETGDLTLTTEGAYNDQEWHHLAMTRTADTVQLWVDGEVAAEGSAPQGSITRGGELLGIDGFFFGQRLDGVNRLAGAMDDVRIYDVALGTQQIGALADGETGLDAEEDLRLHLPFDEVTDGDEPSDPTERLTRLADAVTEYVAAGDIEGPVVNRLTRAVEQAQRHWENDRSRPGIRALERFVRGLENPNNSDAVTEAASIDLRDQATAVIDNW